MTDRKARILIVDDIPDNLQVLGMTLKESGRYRIAYAENGEDALTLIERQPPDLILLDVMMPGINGFDLCRQLKQDNRYQSIPIIFLTAASEPDSIIKGFKVGGSGYVTKPFHTNVLLARVETHLKLYQYHQREEVLRQQERYVAYQNGLIEMSVDFMHVAGNSTVGMEVAVKGVRKLREDFSVLAVALKKVRKSLTDSGKTEKNRTLLSTCEQLLEEKIPSIVEGYSDALSHWCPNVTGQKLI